jgi:hypothetical protein
MGGTDGSRGPPYGRRMTTIRPTRSPKALTRRFAIALTVVASPPDPSPSSRPAYWCAVRTALPGRGRGCRGGRGPTDGRRRNRPTPSGGGPILGSTDDPSRCRTDGSGYLAAIARGGLHRRDRHRLERQRRGGPRAAAVGADRPGELRARLIAGRRARRPVSWRRRAIDHGAAYWPWFAANTNATIADVPHPTPPRDRGRLDAISDRTGPTGSSPISCTPATPRPERTGTRPGPTPTPGDRRGRLPLLLTDHLRHRPLSIGHLRPAGQVPR